MTKSIKEAITHEIIIKKSRFITYLFPCSQLERFKEVYQNICNTYPDASHHCFAYIIQSQERANDDGEPSQTAGMPMLNVLQRQGLNNIAAITTRYFGGTKLGAGGLVRAYSDSVAQALLQAQIVETIPVPLYDISVDYSFSKKIDYLLSHDPTIIIVDRVYSDQVIYRCYVKDENIFERIQDMTSNLYTKELISIDEIEK